MITLPWPPRELHPNARVHWAKKSKHTKACRTIADWGARAAKITAPKDGPISVRIVFCQPDKRRRDLDGALSSCKAYLDGVADGLGVDDSRFKLSIEFGDVVKGGQVHIFVKGGA